MAESDNFLQPSQRKFLAAFSACGSIVKASRWAKIHRQTHYDWIRNTPGYEQAFNDAQLRAARALEDEAVRRAHDGIRKVVRYKGRIVGFETEYSDSLLLALLKANAPEKFRDRTDNRHSGPNGEKLPDWTELLAAMRPSGADSDTSK